MIYQKLDNIVEYYDRIREYFDTMASKLTSRIDVAEAWGKQKSIGDLFDLIGLSIQKQKISDDEIFALQTGVAKEDFRPSEEVQEDLNKTRTNISDTGIRENRELERQALEENREYYQSLLDQKAQIKQAIKDSTDKAEKKALRKQLKEIKKKIRENKPTKGQERLYGMDNNIIGALGNMGEGSDYYNKAVEKNKKLQAKQDEYDRIQAEILEKQAQLKAATSKEEQKALKKEIKQLKKQAKQYKLSRKQEQVLKATGEQIEAMNELQDNIYVNFEVANSELYQGLLARIGELQSKDKLSADEQNELAMKLDMLNAINHGVTIDNLSNYMKVYSRWWELNNKKNLTAGERLELESLSKKKEQFENNFVEFVQGLEEELNGSLMAEGKIPVDPEKAFKDEQEYWTNWRDEQLKNNQEGYKDTPEYREWAKKLEKDRKKIQKYKDIKAKPKSQRTTDEKQWLQNHKDEMDAVIEEEDMISRMFEALKKGGTASNIVDFINTFLKNEQANKKLKNGKLTSKNGENDWSQIATTTQLALQNWYDKKSQEADRIQTEFEEQIDEADKRRKEAIAEGTAASNEAIVEIAGYAKQIIEYEIDSVQAAVDGLGAMVDRYKSVVDLLQTTSLDNLKKYGVMDLFGLDDDKTLEQLLTEKITGAIEASESKISESLAAIDMYTELAGAFEKSDFTDIMSKYYDKLSDDQKQWVDEAIKYLNENEDASSTWLTDINTRLADVTNGIKDSIEDIKALKEAFREQVVFKAVNKAIEDLEKLNKQLSAAAGLIKDDWVVIGGEITEYGKGKLALLGQLIEGAQKDVDKYREKYSQAQQAWLDGAYDSEEEYRADLQELSEKQMAAMSQVQSYMDQVWQIGKKAQEEEINNLKKVAQARVDALKKKKEYYDFDKTLKNKTKDVENLQAQLDALANINTAESKAQRAKLEESLANAQEELDDTLKNHEFDLQTQALEKYISDLDDVLNKALETLEETLEEYFSRVSNTLGLAEGIDPNEILKDIYGGYMGNRDYTPIPVTLSTDDVPVISKRDVFRSKYSGNTITSSSDELLDYDHNNLDDQVKIAREIEELEKKYKEAFNYIPISQDDYLKSLNAKISNITSFMQSMPNGIPNSMYNDYNSLIRELAEATNTSNNVNVTLNYDNLINVTGSVDATVVKDLEKLSKDIVIQTKKSLADDLRKLGVARSY